MSLLPQNLYSILWSDMEPRDPAQQHQCITPQPAPPLPSVPLQNPWWHIVELQGSLEHRQFENQCLSQSSFITDQNWISVQRWLRKAWKKKILFSIKLYRILYFWFWVFLVLGFVWFFWNTAVLKSICALYWSQEWLIMCYFNSCSPYISSLLYYQAIFSPALAHFGSFLSPVSSEVGD